MGLGLPELFVILLIVLVIFGAGKLPSIGDALGRSIRNFKRASSGDDDAIEDAAQQGCFHRVGQQWLAGEHPEVLARDPLGAAAGGDDRKARSRAQPTRLAGVPAYVPEATRSATTVAPAPTRQPAPSVTSCTTVAPAPIMQSSPIVTPPQTVAPGATCTLSPTVG